LKFTKTELKKHFNKQIKIMDQKSQALRAFITKALAEHGYEPEEAVFQAIEQTVTLTEKPGSEAEETRSGHIKEASDGKISAEIFSLYNLSRVSFYDLFGVLMTEAGILLMTDDTKLKIGLALGKMIYDFYPKLTYKLNDLDAKIMLAIYHVQTPTFQVEAVAEAFEAQFGQSIEAAQLTRSLEFLVSLDFLKKSNGLYSPRQRMHYERD
jgi:hypothetical protein